VTESNLSSQPSREGRAALSRELANFLIELSISLHKHAMYPEGHPSLAPAAERVAGLLAPLIGERGTLSLGVAREQLVIEGVATDPKNPVLADLAGRLHRHHLGAVTFRQGADGEQIRDLLATLAVEADRTGKPLGLGPSGQLTAWPSITLYPLTYDALELVGAPERDADEEEDGEARTRADQLWVGLARAALASDQIGEGTGGKPQDTDPTVVAQAIDSHEGGTAYDQVIVGYLLKIAEELRTAQGSEAAALKKRVSRMVSSLDDNTKQRLLHMGGNRSQRSQFMLNASEGMTLDAVVDLVKAWSSTEEQSISHSLVRMLEKLSMHAAEGSGARRQQAESSLREQVQGLIQNWSLTDPNPDEYTKSLQAMASDKARFSVPAEAQFKPEPRRILEMALEVNVAGEMLHDVIDQLMEEGELPWLIETIDQADAPAVAEAVWGYIGGVEKIKEVLQSDPVDAEVLTAIIDKVGMRAAEPMLDVLAESEATQARRLLIDKLIELGSEVGPRVVAWMDDPRWYVQRNMLSVLAGLPELPPNFNGAKLLQHSDARVRRKAVQVVLRDPNQRTRAICTALADSEEGIVRVGLLAALESCPEAAIPQVVQRAISSEARDQRIAAISVLGACGRPAALDALLTMARPKRRSLFGRQTLSRSGEVKAVLKALRSYAKDERARRILEIAARSKDPDVARAAKGEE
jgi:HEAT repeat protein